MADKRERIDVTVELEDELSRPARTASGSVDELSDEVDELSASAAAATTQTGRLERALRALRRASGSARKDLADDTREMKRWTAAREAATASNDMFITSLRKAGKETKGFGFIMKGLKLWGIASAITVIAAAISGLGAAAFAAVAGLAPLVGILGAMPALVAGLAAGLVAVKVGVGGIGDALKVVTDATKTSSEMQDALRGLSPEARELVGVIADLKAETDGWRDSIGAAMLPQFSEALRGMNKILPNVEAGLVGAGGAMGDLALAVGGVISSSGRGINQIFATSETLIRTGLTPAATAFTRIMRDFLIAGGPQAERFARWTGEMATNLADVVEQGRKSGRLEAFLERAGNLAADVGTVFGDVSVALFNMGRQAGGLASSMGGGFADMIHDWRLWTESVAGQNALADWFRDAGPLISELGRTMKILGESFLNLAADGSITAVVRQINDQLLPAVAEMGSLASQVLIPALITAATAFVEFQVALGTTPLPEMLMGIATAALAIVEAFQMLPGPLRILIASVLAFNFGAKIMGATMGLVTRQAGPLGAALGDVRAGMSLYSEGARGMQRATGVARGAMAGLASAGKGLFAAMGGPWGLALAGGTIALGVWANEQANSKARVQELSASLDEQTGALTENSKAAVARMLIDKGWNDEKLKEYGLTLGEVTEATIAGGDALSELRTQAENDWNFDPTLVASMDFLELSGGDVLSRDLASVSKELGIAQENVSSLAAASTDTTQAVYGAARGMTVAEMRAAGLMRAAGETARGMRNWGNQTQYVITKTKALNDLTMKSLRSQIGFRQAADDTRKVMFKGQMTLDLHTQAGRDNRSAMLDLVEAANGVTNAGKRQKALKEAEAIIREWGAGAGWSKERIDALVDSMIKTERTVRRLDGSKVNITVSADGMTQFITDVDRATDSLNDLVASQGQFQVEPVGQGGRGRRHGGPVAANTAYTVGEAGPELFLSPSGVEIIGAHGLESRTFSESGWVLPHESYEALPAAAPEPAREHAMSGAGGGPDLPEIHNHFHGGGAPSPADVEAATLRAWRKFDRERRERGQGPR